MKRKLTNEQVEDIRKRVYKTDSVSGLAREFGVDRKTIYNNLSEKNRIGNLVRVLKYKNLSIEKYIPKKKEYKTQIRNDLVKGNSMYKEILYKQQMKDKKDLKISVLYAHRMIKK